ncbi:uncharacterized protein EDB91DRAFT_47572 [Suillus paluster]|uniref:uncharacterized protein n=1 Tax=Suillus paluster TaxID=48578 RepID=UPI001B863071|nr:uncharacterized protein EDB91DRAFT_47572 [Suillus paluster]KAG1747857.1 hypothetical protein EDB91DRAFT_47572 [Suillus paluster]
MSGLKSLPSGKRLRITHQANEDDNPRRNRQHINSIFYICIPSRMPHACAPQDDRSDAMGLEDAGRPVIHVLKRDEHNAESAHSTVAEDDDYGSVFLLVPTYIIPRYHHPRCYLSCRSFRTQLIARLEKLFVQAPLHFFPSLTTWAGGVDRTACQMSMMQALRVKVMQGSLILGPG